MRDRILILPNSCPVCFQNLDEVGDANAQEAHVKSCLDGGAGSPPSAKYLVYRLPAESALLGVECMSFHLRLILPRTDDGGRCHLFRRICERYPWPDSKIEKLLIHFLH